MGPVSGSVLDEEDLGDFPSFQLNLEIHRSCKSQLLAFQEVVSHLAVTYVGRLKSAAAGGPTPRCESGSSWALVVRVSQPISDPTFPPSLVLRVTSPRLASWPSFSSVRLSMLGQGWEGPLQGQALVPLGCFLFPEEAVHTSVCLTLCF